jgi:hypothetical protein
MQGIEDLVAAANANLQAYGYSPDEAYVHVHEADGRLLRLCGSLLAAEAVDEGHAIERLVRQLPTKGMLLLAAEG